MTPTFPPCRCYEAFKKNSECNTTLIQNLFKLQKEKDIHAMSIQEIEQALCEMTNQEIKA